MNLLIYTVVISGRKEIKMQDISNLIKEARPLYHKRKKQRRVVKSALLGMVCLFVVFVNMPNYKINDDFYNPTEVEIKQIITEKNEETLRTFRKVNNANITIQN